MRLKDSSNHLIMDRALVPKGPKMARGSTITLDHRKNSKHMIAQEVNIDNDITKNELGLKKINEENDNEIFEGDSFESSDESPFNKGGASKRKSRKSTESVSLNSSFTNSKPGSVIPTREISRERNKSSLEI